MAKLAADRALDIFRARGGILRTSDALNLGIAPRVLYFLRDSGKIEPVCRGVYRLADALPEGSMDVRHRHNGEALPRPVPFDLPALLEDVGPRVQAYTHLSVLAEKLYAIIDLAPITMLYT